MPHSHYIKIIRNTFGKVAVATRPIDKNMLVRVMNGYNITYPTQTSIRLGVEQHHEDRVGKFINHSCSPNCEVEGTGFKIWVTAIRDIKKNEELTYDYGFSYDSDYKQFPCKCRSKNCCGYIVREESRWRINKKYKKSLRISR